MHTRRRSTQAVRSWNLSLLLRTWRRILSCRLPLAKRPNGLSRNIGGLLDGGEAQFPEEKWQHLDYLARYTIWAGSTSFFLRFLFTFTSSHVFSRRLMRPNAGVHASPRVPVKRPRHLISYGWRHLRQSSHGPPHLHLLSRPVDKDLWCHSSSASSPFLSSLFLPYPFLTLFEGTLSSFLFFFDFEREGRIEVCSLSSEGEERNFRYRRVWNESKRTIVIPLCLFR